MKKLLLGALLSAGIALPTAIAQVYVRIGPPPPPRREVVAVRPGPRYVWVPGYNRWDGRAYAWTPGAWVLPPPNRRGWVPGRWRNTPRGYYWTEGHWR